MNKKLSIASLAVACTLCAAMLPAAAQNAKKPGDPARWYKGNQSEQQSMATLKKEIGAAYAQQKGECGRQARAERAACLDQARQTYNKDMAQAPQLVAQAPSGGIQERVVGTVDSGGSTAVGASQGGSSASGADEKGMDVGAAATGNAGANGGAASGADAPQTLEPQPMQPPAAANPPRSEDTPIQR